MSRKRPTTTQTSILQEDAKSDEQQRYTTVESVNNQYFTNTPETTTRTYGSVSRRRTTIQTEQYSTPSPSSSSYSLPSTLTTKVTPAFGGSGSDDTNAHDSQYTTNVPTQNHNLGTNSELTTDLTPSVVIESNQNQNRDHLLAITTTDSNLSSGVSVTTVTPSTFGASDVQSVFNDKKTDTLTETNSPQLTPTISKFSFSSINTDSNSNSLTNQEKTDATTSDEHLSISKLTTTTLPTNDYPSPTVTPSSIVVNRRPVANVNLTFGSGSLSTSTQTAPIETSTLFKPFVGVVSSPRPFGFSKRTRPTTTTTSTTELPSFTTAITNSDTNVPLSDAKVSVANNAIDRDIQFERNLLTKELQSLNQYRDMHKQIVDGNPSTAQVSGDSGLNGAIESEQTTIYSIAKDATNDENTVNNDTNLNSSDFISTTTTPASTTATVSSVVNNSNAFARRRNATRVNTSSATEQNEQNRFVQRRRLRTRPTSAARSVPNEQEQPSVAFDDGVRSVTYNIARQHAGNEAPAPAPATENTQENVQPSQNRDRTNIIRRRGFRPKLSDLIKETSNGLPVLSNAPQEDRPYRPEQDSDFSSLTAIDFNRQNTQTFASNRQIPLRRRPQYVDSAEVAKEQQAEIETHFEKRVRTRPTRISTTSAPISVANDGSRHRFNPIRSRSTTALPADLSPVEDSAVEQSGKVVLNVSEVADSAETETEPNVSLSLARKITFDDSYKNRLNAVQRKPLDEKTLNNGESRILFLHPRLFKTKSPQNGLNSPEVTVTSDGDLANTSINLESANQLSEQTNETLNSLLLEAIDTTRQTEDHQNDTLFDRKIMEIKDIVDSFKTTEKTLNTEFAPNSAEDSETPIESSTPQSKRTVSVENERNAFNQRRRRPFGRQTTENPAATSSQEANASIENSSENQFSRRRSNYSRRRPTTSTSTEEPASNEESSTAANRYRKPVYRGRVKASNEVISQYSNKSSAESTENQSSETLNSAESGGIDAQNSSAEALSKEINALFETNSSESNSSAEVEHPETVDFDVRLDTSNEEPTTEKSQTENGDITNAIIHRRKNVIIRRRPAYRNENSSAEVTQSIDDSAQRQRYRGRVRSTTTESPSQNETESQSQEENSNLSIESRRRRIFGRPTSAPKEIETVEKTSDENSQNENENTSNRRKVIRRRPINGRQRTTTTTTESSVESTENSLQAQNKEHDEISLIKQRTYIREEIVTEENASNENESNVNVADEEAHIENELISSRRRQQYNRRFRTSTDPSTFAEEVSSFNEINARRRRPEFGRTRVRSTTEASYAVDEQSENQSVENQTENEKPLRFRPPALRTRPAYGRVRSTTEPVEENQEENQSNEETNVNDESPENVEQENVTPSRDRVRFKPSFTRTRLPSTFGRRPSNSGEAENAQENEQPNVDENKDEEEKLAVPRTRPSFSRTRVSTFRTQSGDTSSDRQIARNRFRLRAKTNLNAENQTSQTNENEEKPSESVSTEAAPRYRFKSSRKPYSFRRTTEAASTEHVEQESEEKTEANAVQDIESATESEKLELGTTIANEIETQTVHSYVPPDVTRRYYDSKPEKTDVIEPVTESDENMPTEHTDFFITQKSLEDNEIEQSTDVIPNTESAQVTSTSTTTTENVIIESSSEAIDVSTKGTSDAPNGRKRRRKIKKIRSTTAAPLSSENVESSSENASETQTPVRRPSASAQAVLRLRESRKQALKTKQVANNNLETNENENNESVANQNADEIDHDEQTETRQRTNSRTNVIKSRVPFRPSRPSFSLTSTTEQSATQKKFVRKYTKNFSLPKPPNAEEEFVAQNQQSGGDNENATEENVESEQRFVVDDENADENEQHITPNRPKSFRINTKPSSADGAEKASKSPNRPVFGKSKQAKNRLSTTTIHPASARTFERKRVQSTEATVDLDGIDVDALSARNRNIFNSNSKKHSNILKHKTSSTAPQTTNKSSDDSDGDMITTTELSASENTELPSTSQQFNFVQEIVDRANANDFSFNTNTLTSLTDDDDIATTTSLHDLIEQDRDAIELATDNLNSINLVDTLQATATIKPSRKLYKTTTSTTTPKPTTFHHVFAIDYDEHPKNDDKPNEISKDDKNAEVISKKIEKLAEVNRIVEVYSQQRKQTIQRSSNAKAKSENSNLIIERLPTVDKLGEISRITLIKLVEPNSNESKSPSAKEFIGFLTTTAQPPKASQEKKARQIFIPDNIFSVETSTIPLEGLFQTDRNGKKLNIVYATTLEDSYTKHTDYVSNPSPVYIPTTTPVPQTSTIRGAVTDTTADAVQNDIRIVKAQSVQPTASVHINDSTSPLVISLTNLDNVILSHIAATNSSANEKSPDDFGSVTQVDGAIASSGKVSTIVDAPTHVDNDENSTVDNLEHSSVVNTQTSYSSEITKTKVKLSQLNDLNKSHAPSGIDDGNDKVSDS